MSAGRVLVAVRRRGLRARLLASVLATIALVLAVLTVAFNIVLAGRLSSDASSVVDARASSALAALHVVGDRILLPEAPDQASPDTSVWVFEGHRAIERPQGRSVSPAQIAQAAAAAPATRDLGAPALRLRSLPVASSRGRVVGAVVAGVSLAPYAETRNTALIASTILALLAFLAVAFACNWVITRALRPVSQMTRQAADWSEHDLDRRFGLGSPRDEFTHLAATLDDLLGRLSASLRHEQRLSAELSHELRTPLAGIQAQAQFALRHAEADTEAREALQEIVTAARRMTVTLDTLIAAARAELDPRGASSDAAAAVRAAVRAAATAVRSVVPRIGVSAREEPIPVAVEQQLVERMLAPLLENAYRYGDGSAHVDVSLSGARVLITVSDEGPGVAPEESEAIFEPGWQGRAASGVTGATAVAGAGLGLPLARRLARSAGGDVRAIPSPHGARFVIELPAGRPRPR